MNNQIQTITDLIDDFLNNAPSDDVKALFNKIDQMDIYGPTVDEYFLELDKSLKALHEELGIHYHNDFLVSFRVDEKISSNINFDHLSDLGSIISKRGITLPSFKTESLNLNLTSKNKKKATFEDTFEYNMDDTFSWAA